MEEKISYLKLDDTIIERAKQWERFVLTSEGGEELVALISLEDLEIVKGYERFIQQEMEEGLGDEEEKASYFELNDMIIERAKGGERFVLTSEGGKDAAALVSLEDLEVINEYERVEDAMDIKAIMEAEGEEVTSWEAFKDE